MNGMVCEMRGYPTRAATLDPLRTLNESSRGFGAWLQFDANGYAFINTGNGQNHSGTWKVDGGKLCTQWQRFPSSCGDVRAKAAVLHVQRADGSWATMSAP